MLEVEFDVSEIRRMAAEAQRDLERGTARAVDEASREGKARGRVLAPHQTYALRESIDGRLLAITSAGADGELRADAEHADHVANGTKPHVIEPRRKKVLRWVGAGGEVFARRVNHPGTKPHAYWREAIAAAKVRLERVGEDVVDQISTRLSR
jgi:hypothetical protein